MLIGAEDLRPVDASAAPVVSAPSTFCRQTVVVDVAGLACAVHFDAPATARWFASRYADLVTAETPRRHAFAMTDPVLGHLFWSLGGPVYRWPHGRLEDGIVAFLADAVALTSFFQHRDDGIVSLHAAALGTAGGVALIVGDSNAGKTTTAVACARAGMDLYSDERGVIDRQSRVHPFRRSINLRAPGLRLLAAETLPGPDPIGAALRAHGDGDWDDVRLSQLFPLDRPLRPQPLRAVFVLAGAGAEATAEAASPAQAARACARWAQGAGTGLEKVSRLLELFAPVPCFRLRLGSPAATAHLIRSIVQTRAARLEYSA